MQYLITILLILAVYFIFIKKKPLPSQNDTKNKSDKLQSNDMLECASCGIYVELSETIISNNKYYCSQQCVDKA
ncbi:MAG: hypothetical protein JKY28_02265 [Sulfurimonas sp.]|nr:hypothetical protein [Sulfurimonas sp.]PHQ89602.1 MAG: hypothetical protein COB42_06610 [Sulfurimonas sp.]